MAIVKKYHSEIISFDNPLPGIYEARFKSLEKPYKFKPGQFLHLALDDYNPSLPWPESRCFSIQSSPEEDSIKITFSVKGVFTKRMSEELSSLKNVYLKLPYGDLFSHNHAKEQCVFIAGGTGITPFLSLFNSQLFAEYQRPQLYLGLKNKDYNIYQEELQQGLAINNSFLISYYYEDIDGILDIEKIVSGNSKDSVYFISGPPQMIKNFKQYLITNDVAADTIITDDWE